MQGRKVILTFLYDNHGGSNPPPPLPCPPLNPPSTLAGATTTCHDDATPEPPQFPPSDTSTCFIGKSFVSYYITLLHAVYDDEKTYNGSRAIGNDNGMSLANGRARE